ncbi:MAG: DeoR/GlpR transcriptional regulator [Chloroflexi bacterium]|nr:DeoR/GlpR transcriptional regulator [Chloroflexota bacterium]
MGKPLIPAQRRDHIREHLEIHKFVRIANLSEMLDVSEATIRRDLERLEKGGILERTHGGAICSQRLNLEQDYAQRAQRYPDEKRWIGALAASMIESGDIVFINSGTTSTELIRQIPPNQNITVLTNNLIAALEVGAVDFELILLGGSFQPVSNSVGGRFAVENLGTVYADKAFISVDGISLKYGCTFPTSEEAEVVHRMMERTRGPVIVVTDQTKWGTVSNFEVLRIDQIDRLIIDEGLDENARAALVNQSVDVFIAEKPGNETPQ